MTEREQADVGADMLHPVEEEDDAEQEQYVIEAGHHVLGAQVNKREQVYAGDLLDVALVTGGDGMRKGCARAKHDHCREQRKASGEPEDHCG